MAEPDYRGARDKAFRRIWKQWRFDMWAGQTIRVDDEDVPMLSVPMWQLEDLARAKAKDIAREGVARNERSDSIIGKMRRGEAL